jgi:HEAT repeat protein
VLDDLQRLTTDEDASVRAAALRAIGAHAASREDGDARERAVVLLEQGLKDESVASMAAVEGLSALGGTDAARAAVYVLERPEPELVQAAVACVGAHGDAPSVEALLPLVMHPDWAVRAEAIQTLAERRVAKAVPPILRRLEVEQDQFVRDAILRALKRLEG